MRKAVFFSLAFALLAGCVTINVYFPAAAAQQAAEKFIGNVIGPDTSAAKPAAGTPPAASSSGAARPEPAALKILDALVPPAQAAEAQPNLTVRTPEIDAIQARMRTRYHASLEALLNSGAVGFTHNGDVAIRDAAAIPLPARAAAQQAVAGENADRAQLYQQIANANGHPEWATRMREAFARQWINLAHAGWYYQNAAGAWQRK